MKSTSVQLPFDDPKALSRAVTVIQSGGLIAFPTDTVYGIGSSAFLPEAIERIYQVKGRNHLKAIPILVSSFGDLAKVTPRPSRVVSKLIDSFWPGPLTLVLPCLPSLPNNLSPYPTIGVRLPDHELTQELIRNTGPLAATSANLSGQSPALTAEEVVEQLEGHLELILDGGKAPGGIASTVLDCTGDELVLLREGPLSWSEIQAVLARPA